MRKRNYLLAILMGMLALSPVGAQEKSPLAVLLSCKGDVTIKKASGETVKGVFGVSLMDGDVVLAAKVASLRDGLLSTSPQFASVLLEWADWSPPAPLGYELAKLERAEAAPRPAESWLTLKVGAD